MLYRYFLYILCLFIAVGCGRFDKQVTSIVTPGEDNNLSVNCIRLFGVPFMCAVVNQTTKTILIEDVVTNIVERVVKKEIVSEVPIDKIVKRIETKYVETGKEVDIKEIVERVIERIKVYVDPKDIIDIPLEDIVHDTIENIQNPPPSDKDQVPSNMGEIRNDELKPIIPTDDEDDTPDNIENPLPPTKGETPDDESSTNPPTNVKDDTKNPPPTDNNQVPPTKGETPNDESTPMQPTDDEDDSTDNIKNPPPTDNNQVPPTKGETPIDESIPMQPINDEDDSTDNIKNPPPTDNNQVPPTKGETPIDESAPMQPIDDENDTGMDPISNDILNDNAPFGDSKLRLHVQIGPKEMDFSLILDQPGVSYSVTCNIDGNTVNPDLDSYSVFREDKWNEWGIQFWCRVPENIKATEVTINVNVNDFKRWCGLTPEDITVSKFIDNGDGTSTGRGKMDAGINLTPNPVPLCDRNTLAFTEGTETIRYVTENTATDVEIGAPIVATSEENGMLEYSLGGIDAVSFSIVNTSGQLKTSSPLDYEIKNSYSVLVTVTSGDFTNTINVTISITNVNESPIFTEGTLTYRSIPENSDVGVDIGTPVLATDPDVGDVLVYTIQSLEPGAFDTESTTGQLKTNIPLDYETKSLYWISVTATDLDNASASITVQVTVTDANDSPVFTEGTETTRVVIEDTESGTDFGEPVEATDEDGDTLEYSLGGTDASSFSINSDSGQLSTNVSLDYDTKSRYSITVSASDGNGGTASIAVSIEVLEAYIPKEEFFEVYYAIKLNEGLLDVQCYSIRGYGYDDTTPIYVDNYYKFENGSTQQTSTGWGSATEEGSIAEHLENQWKINYSEDDGYQHGSTKVSVHDRTADEARKLIYTTICNAAKNIGTPLNSQAGVTYPEIDNNKSDDILSATVMHSYLDDDDCDPNN